MRALGDGHCVITLQLRGAGAVLVGDLDLLTVDYEENPFPMIHAAIAMGDRHRWARTRRPCHAPPAGTGETLFDCCSRQERQSAPANAALSEERTTLLAIPWRHGAGRRTRHLRRMGSRPSTLDVDPRRQRTDGACVRLDADA